MLLHLSISPKRDRQMQQHRQRPGHNTENNIHILYQSIAVTLTLEHALLGTNVHVHASVESQASKAQLYSHDSMEPINDSKSEWS